MAKKSAKKATRAPSTAKSNVKKRTLNSATAAGSKKKSGQSGQPFAEQDPKRRLGNFEGKGEAPLRLQRGGARRGWSESGGVSNIGLSGGVQGMPQKKMSKTPRMDREPLPEDSRAKRVGKTDSSGESTRDHRRDAACRIRKPSK